MERAPEEPWQDAVTSIGVMREGVAAFTTERDWDRFHTAKDLAIALSVEAGELLQLFLWVDDSIDGGRPAPDASDLEAEVADIAICLLNLCNREGIDLAGAVKRKLASNAAKYPISKARGSALKYSEYDQGK